MVRASATFRSVLVFAILAVNACRGAVDEARQYELQGQILGIRREDNVVVIKHGDIKGFMPGMTMPFKVREPALLDGKSPGDLVTAQLMVGSNEAWIARLDKTGSAALDEVVAPSPAAFVVPLKPGDAAPDMTVTDQDGNALGLSSLMGKAVLLTFIYTRCPLPQFCPMMDHRFAEVQRAAAADPALAGRTRLLSVSFDPDYDRPEMLKAHAVKVGADPAIWTFATASSGAVDRVAAAFGVNVIREKDRTISHNLRTALIDPAGRVADIYSSGDWTAARAVEDLRRVLSGQ